MDAFSFKMPTRFVFGPDTEDEVGRLVAHYGGTKALILYGCGTTPHSDLLKRVRESFDRSLLDYVELGDVKSEPRTDVVYEGISLVRDEHVDFVLALGGGSVVDTAKAIAAGACFWGDVWEFYGGGRVLDKALPIGCVSTALDSGATASPYAKLVDNADKLFQVSSQVLVPTFSVLDPALTLDESADQAAGDIGCLEKALSAGTGVDATGDSLPRRLVATLADAVSRRAERLADDALDMESREELMWASVVASSGFIAAGSHQFQE